MALFSRRIAPRVDIGDGYKEIEIEQEYLTYGHTVQDSIQNANPFSTTEDRSFERKVVFKCSVMPTSFRFRITFSRSQGRTVTTVGSIKRMDQEDGLVNVTLVAIVTRNGERVAFSRHRFLKLGAGEVDRIADCVLVDEETRTLEQMDNLIVEFAITIICCHDEEEVAKAKDTPPSKDPFSKKRPLAQSSS